MADRETVLRGYLMVLAEMAEAKVGAVFEPRGTKPMLLAHTARLTQEALDVAELAWRAKRPVLEQGGSWRSGPAIVWQLRSSRGETVGLVYLDHVQRGFPDAAQAHTRDLMVDVLVHTEPRALGPEIAQEDNDGGLRAQLVLALGRCSGSVATTARLLGVSRQTVYERIERFGVSLREFRLR